MRLLIVEDDKSIAALMRRVLSEDGYAIDVANTGEEGRLLAFVNQYDGIVMDLDVPFLFRPFQKRAMEVIEREVQVWIGKARSGEIG